MKNTDTTKYLSRCHYYGKLKNWEYAEGGALVLLLTCFTACQYFGGNTTVRLYVPTELEDDIKRDLIVGETYYAIAVPYKLVFKQSYRYRVDLLLNLFKGIA